MCLVHPVVCFHFILLQSKRFLTVLKAVLKQPPPVEALGRINFQDAKDLKTVHCKLVLAEGVSLSTAHIFEEAGTALVEFACVGVLLLLAEFFARDAHFFEKGELLLPLRVLVTLWVSPDLSHRHFDPDVLAYAFQYFLLFICASDW